jgi:hypothetical protein
MDNAPCPGVGSPLWPGLVPPLLSVASRADATRRGPLWRCGGFPTAIVAAGGCAACGIGRRFRPRARGLCWLACHPSHAPFPSCGLGGSRLLAITRREGLLTQALTLLQQLKLAPGAVPIDLDMCLRLEEASLAWRRGRTEQAVGLSRAVAADSATYLRTVSLESGGDLRRIDGAAARCLEALQVSLARLAKWLSRSGLSAAEDPGAPSVAGASDAGGVHAPGFWEGLLRVLEGGGGTVPATPLWLLQQVLVLAGAQAVPGREPGGAAALVVEAPVQLAASRRTARTHLALAELADSMYQLVTTQLESPEGQRMVQLIERRAVSLRELGPPVAKGAEAGACANGVPACARGRVFGALGPAPLPLLL